LKIKDFKVRSWRIIYREYGFQSNVLLGRMLVVFGIDVLEPLGFGLNIQMLYPAIEENELDDFLLPGCNLLSSV
jgi:hypothetical protein